MKHVIHALRMRLDRRYRAQVERAKLQDELQWQIGMAQAFR